MYEFDPDVSQKRRSLYYEVMIMCYSTYQIIINKMFQTHGYRGEKYIELVGLGIDGREEERRQAQTIRDQGRLNGVIYLPEFHNPKLKIDQN